MKKLWLCLLALLTAITTVLPALSVQAAGPEITAPSAVLMEASTGRVLFQKEPHQQRPCASITKVMTLCLVFEAMDSGRLSLEQTLTTSAHAASMGGSDIWLEEGETMSVDDLLKATVIMSANDAAVVLAEAVSGSEEAFVAQMNEKAQQLGMNDTVFKNCNGLDTDGHVTTARDIALMSRELITKYPDVYEYTKIWMDTIVHKTKKGEEEFGLSNTNKLIRQYSYATGLKTGSTGEAKFCLSATAQKDGIDLIAVIMAAPDVKTRFADAQTLLNYGFSICRKYEDPDWESVQKTVKVERGEEDQVKVVQKSGFSYLDVSGADVSGVEKKVVPKASLKAPVKKGQKAGTVQYLLNGEKIGEVELAAADDVPAMSLKHAIEDVLDSFSL